MLVSRSVEEEAPGVTDVAEARNWPQPMFTITFIS
jgi:hypothetical protein